MTVHRSQGIQAAGLIGVKDYHSAVCAFEKGAGHILAVPVVALDIKDLEQYCDPGPEPFDLGQCESVGCRKVGWSGLWRPAWRGTRTR